MKLAMKLSVEQHEYWIEIIIIIYVDGNTRNKSCFKQKAFFIAALARLSVKGINQFKELSFHWSFKW